MKYFKNAVLSKEDAKRLYFDMKKSFELAKEIYSNINKYTDQWHNIDYKGGILYGKINR